MGLRIETNPNFEEMSLGLSKFPQLFDGIDLIAGGKSKRTERTAPRSDDVYLKLIVKYMCQRCPVLQGEMWFATKFFCIKAITGVKVQSQVDDSDSSDEDDSCPKWAAIGECQRNPVFMIGSPDYYGTCRNS